MDDGKIPPTPTSNSQYGTAVTLTYPFGLWLCVACGAVWSLARRASRVAVKLLSYRY